MKRSIGSLAIAMFVSIALLLIAPAAAGAGASAAPILRARENAIPNQYIVVLKQGADARIALAAAGIVPKYSYEAALNGFAARLNAGQLNALKNNPNVAYIEQDAQVTINATQFMDANGDPWGLDRIDQRFLPLSGTYTYNGTGAGVNAYIIDTGIETSHPEFGGRALNVFDALGGTGADCNGHGTHMAGIVGAKTWGVAKKVNLRGVRVLSCSGSGSISQVIAGVNWVTANRVRPAVANMSLGGSFNSSLNTAVANMIAAGVVTAVSAGASNSNACNFSPASVATAITTAASDRTDRRASFSNFGSCVDLYAPGVSIKSTWLGGTTRVISGTSTASAHVTGVEALCAGAGTPNCSIGRATPGVIIGNPPGTPNRLLYMGGL